MKKFTVTLSQPGTPTLTLIPDGTGTVSSIVKAGLWIVEGLGNKGSGLKGFPPTSVVIKAAKNVIFNTMFHDLGPTGKFKKNCI